MDPAEKIARHAKLYKVVTTHTSHTWAAVLVKMLLGQMGLQGMARQTPYIPKGKLEEMYVKAKKRLFLFDYDVCLFYFLFLHFALSFFLTDCHWGAFLLIFFRELFLRLSKSPQQPFHPKQLWKRLRNSLLIHRTWYTSFQDGIVHF